jgi:ATP-dependent protease HslVU (ClpYQ) peptidase subunit
MIVKAMPSLRECLTKNGYNFNESKDSNASERFHFIIACNGELFDVDEELSVIRKENGIYATGSGGQLALGALAMGATALEALEKVSSMSAYTAPPFYSIKQIKK